MIEDEETKMYHRPEKKKKVDLLLRFVGHHLPSGIIAFSSLLGGPPLSPLSHLFSIVN